MKPIVYMLTALMLIATAEAKKKGGNKQQSEKNKQAELEKKMKKEERDKQRKEVEEVLEAKDSNNDGSLTRDEYLTGEADVKAASERFDEYNKNRDRYLSKGEIANSLGH